MKVLVIGGTGHIGSFLVPQLVEDGHVVTVITRGERRPIDNREWEKVTLVKGVYKRDGEFGGMPCYRNEKSGWVMYQNAGWCIAPGAGMESATPAYRGTVGVSGRWGIEAGTAPAPQVVG